MEHMLSRRGFLGIQALAAGALVSGCSAASSSAQSGPRTLNEIRDSHVVRVGVFPDAHPLGYIGPQGTLIGLDMYFGLYLASRLGSKAEFVSVNPRTRYDDLLEGKIDVCASGMSPADTRASEVDLSTPLYALNLSVVSPAAQPITEISQLADGELIVCEGSYAEQYATEMLPDVTLRPYLTLSECYEALEGGQAPALLADNVCAAAWQLSRPDYVVGLRDIATVRTISPASSGDPELADAVNSVIEKYVTRNYLRKAYDTYVGPSLPDSSYSQPMLDIDRAFAKSE